MTHVNNEPVASLCHTEVVRLIVAGGRRLTLCALPLEKTYIRSDRRRRPPGKMAPSSKRSSGSPHRTRHGSAKSVGSAGAGSASGSGGGGSGAASPAVTAGKKSLFRKLSERRRVDLVQLWQQQQQQAAAGETATVSGAASPSSSGPTSPNAAVLRPRPTSLYSPRAAAAPAGAPTSPSPQSSPGHAHQSASGGSGSSRRKSMHLLSSTPPIQIGRAPSPLALNLGSSGPSPPPPAPQGGGGPTGGRLSQAK